MLEGTYRAGHCLCELCSGWVIKASRFLLKDDLEQTLQECVDDILREIRQEEQVVEFGFVEGNVRLKVDNIIYIETSKHKNVFYTAGETYSIYKKMDERWKQSWRGWASCGYTRAFSLT